MYKICYLILLFAPQLNQRAVYNWFYGRLFFCIGIAAIAGAAIALFHLNRLSTDLGNYNVNQKARKWVVFYSVLFIALFDAAMALDISTIVFSDFSFVNWKDVFLSSYSLIIQGSALLTFIIAIALVTRFAKNSRCRYAIIPR